MTRLCQNRLVGRCTCRRLHLRRQSRGWQRDGKPGPGVGTPARTALPAGIALGAGRACGTAGGSRRARTGLVRPRPSPAPCKAARAASAEPRRRAERSTLSHAAAGQAEQGPGSRAAPRRADDAPLPSKSPSPRSSSIFLLGTGGAFGQRGGPPGKSTPGSSSSASSR